MAAVLFSIPILKHKMKLSGMVILTYFQPNFLRAYFPNGIGLKDNAFREVSIRLG